MFRSNQRLCVFLLGAAGSGKSFVAKLIQQFIRERYNLSLPIISSGDRFRANAERHGMTLEEYERFCETHSEEDLVLDAEIFHQLQTSSAIIESRVLPYLRVFDELSDRALIVIRIVATRHLRIQRLSARSQCAVSEARTEAFERDEQLRQRYLRIYQIETQAVHPLEQRVANNRSGSKLILRQLEHILVPSISALPI